MADHVRQQVRAAVGATLGAASIVASGSIFIGRRRPTRDAQLPALLIFTDDEPVHRESTDERSRLIDLTVRIRLSTVGDPPQDDLDALAVKVERALDANPTLGRLVKYLELSRTHGGMPSPMTDRQPGEIDIVYVAEVHTAPGDPTTAV